MKQQIQNLKHIAYRLKTRLLYNSGLGAAMRGIAWSPAVEKDGLKQIYCRERDVFASHTMNHISDEKALRTFTWEVATFSKQRDTIFLAEGEITIEPGHSLAFLAGRKLIVPTRGQAHGHLVPPFFKTVVHSTLSRTYTKYDSLVHFDGFVGRNLYHFFDESVNAYLLLCDTGLIDSNIPFLINEKVYRLKYVQYVLALPRFRDIKWVVQKDGEWIRTARLYKAMPSYEYWKVAYEMMSHHVVKAPHRKVFLNRTPYFQRRLTNSDGIEAILHEHGFETVYAEDLTYEQQVQLFAETKYLVALHGAGVTNLIYTDLKETHVLEVFSESLLHPHFYWFLELLKIRYYDAIVGSPLDINWNYRVDEVRFRDQLERMLRAGELTSQAG